MVFAFNPRRKRRKNVWKGASRRHAKAARKGWRHRKHRRNPVAFNYKRRKHRRNPGLGQLTAAFDPKLLMKSGAVVGGMLATNWATKKVVDFVPVSFLQTKPGNFISELAVAGLLSQGVKYVAPGFAGPIFFGGVLDVLKRAADTYIAPILGGGLAGLADYLTVGNAMSARPLSGLGYDDDGGALEGLDDYLTVGNAASARPLNGYMSGEGAIAEELAVAG